MCAEIKSEARTAQHENRAKPQNRGAASRAWPAYASKLPSTQPAYTKRQFFTFKIFALLLLGLGWLARAARPAAPRLPLTVYVFLAETCPISQQATLPLRALHRQYAPLGVRFVGVFPAPGTTAASVAEFALTYALPFAAQPDAGQRLTRQLGAHTTPEAVVVAADGRTILYQGRLDDQYVALGQRRTLSQHHELANALADLAAGRAVAVPRTQAVGCFIEKAGL